MYKSIIAVAVLCLLLSACVPSGTQKTDETTAPVITPVVTAAPVETAPAEKEEPGVLVVFFSENTEDFSALTVKNAAGEAISPVTSESTGQPVYGVFSLPAGEYRFTMENAGELPFTVDAAYDQVLVPVESPADLFQTSTHSGGVMVNPVYEGTVKEEDIKPVEQSIEEKAASLRDFYLTIKNNP